MPDFERLTRNLELHLCTDASHRQYIIGRHAGMDHARKQVAWLAVFIAVVFLALSITIASAQSSPAPTSPPAHAAQESPADAAKTHGVSATPATATPATVFSAVIPLTGLLVTLGGLWLVITLIIKAMDKRR